MMKLIDRDNIGELRKFGLVLALMFPLIFCLLLPWLFEQPRPAWPLIAGGGFFSMALLWPAGLYPVYRGWMAIAGVLGKVTNTIILSLVFFLMFVPLGIVLRALGKLQYRQGFDPELKTYRVGSRRRPQAEDLKNPF